MGGLTSHNAIKDLDLYAYAGENHIFSHVSNGVGFGNGIIDNSACNADPSLGLTACAGQIDDVWQVTGGFWHRLYDGDKGVVQWGLQDSFTVDTTPDPAPGKGTEAHANMNVTMMSFRYYPKYGTLIGTKP